jgi:hypothetical protein
MGNAASFTDGIEDTAIIPSTIITKKLTHGCNIFVQNDEARAAFVSYLKSGVWMDQLIIEGDGAKALSDAFPISEGNPETTTFQEYIIPDSMDQSALEKLRREEVVMSEPQ